ncbi:MAG: tetratricopeptide repeat protein [Bacteroidetes bacterium]|nr:tetratricopeptide repeat protein [Bacteroidota bacterium]
MNNAAWHLRHNDPVQALEWALRARDLADSASYERGLGWAYRNEAVVEYVLGEYADALTSNLEALRIFERLGERDGIASAHLNIGLVHWQIGNPEKAQQYFHDALAKNPSPTLTATAYGNIGLMHTEQAEYRNALANTEKALDIYRRIGDALGESTMLNNLGWIYELQQKPTDALKYYERSLAIRRKIGDKRRIASVSISIGSILRQQKHFDEALEFLARALQLSREIGDKKQIEASYEEMSRAYADMGNFEQAYLHFVRFAGARDSIVDDRIAVDIAKLEANFRMEQAEREVALLTRANELQSTIVYITSAGLVLVLIFSVVSFIGYRSKSRINRRLEATQKQLIVQEKLASLGQLTAGIAHEIQNPLNFITNFSEVSRELLLELDETDDPEERTAILGDLGQSVRKIHEHGVRADGIVRSMMLHARSSSEEPQLTDVDALISYVIELATHATTASNMPRPPVFDARLEPLLPAVRVVPQDLSQVFLNIINNAVDALSERSHLVTEGYEPRITITTGVQGRSLIIRIRDNGIGIPESIRGRIFEPFYTTKDSGKGTGLGLSISYDLIVQKYGGTIDVASQENEYTEFIMTLPTV